MEIESDEIGGKQVAHFAGSGPRHNSKRKFVKRGKSVRDVDQAFAAISGNSASPSVVCFECGGLGHYKRDCPNLTGSKLKIRAAGTATRLTGASTASRPTSPLCLCLRRLGRFSRPTILKFVQVLDNLSDRSCARPLPLPHNRLSHRLQFGATEPISTMISSSTKQT